MDTTRQRLAALALCVFALASVTPAVAPAAAQTGAGNDDADASNATELDASFVYDEIVGCHPEIEGETTMLTLTADREAYNVTVSAAGLDADELVDIFDEELDTADPAILNIERTDAESVRMRVQGRNVTVPANFSDVDVGEYEFVVESGEDATARATVLKAESSCVDADFLLDSPHETGRSGVATVPITLRQTDEARVSITGDDLSLSVAVADVTDDKIVTLLLNTHLLGRNAPDDGHGRMHWTREGVTVLDSDDAITDITLDDAPGGDDPLPTGDYELAVDRDGTDYTLDTGSLSVTDAAVADFESWMGPADALANATAGDLRRAIADGTLVDNDSVSNGSALVYEIESSSVFGPLEAAASGYDGSDRYTQAFLDIAADGELSAVPGNPVRFGIEADSGARIDLRRTHRNGGLVVARDYVNETLYVGLRTDRLVVANGTAVGSGEEFDASLAVHGEVSRQPVRFRDANATIALPSTPERPDSQSSTTERAPSPTTEPRVSTPNGTAASETTVPSTADTTEGSPDATTTVDGPGFGAAVVVAAVLALGAFAAGRTRD